MCGIVGLCEERGGATSLADLEGLVRRMNARIVHRGPDGEGTFGADSIAMGMRRLSVIDLEGGWQPLFARNGEVVAFQNGEIYDYRELREELRAQGAVFRTESDTEVLAQGYAAWGMRGLLERIDGMYAIAILDRASRTLWLARDRFGEKPLFYARFGERFAWASSLHALRELEDLPLEVDPRSIEHYLALHFVPGDSTVFRGVKRVLPGEFLKVDLDTLAVERERYYELPLGTTRECSTDDLAALVEKAVESRLVSDVPVGVFLSGGLDSSTLAAVAGRLVTGIDTFSMGFASAKHDESEHARRVADLIGSRHHHFLFDEGSFLTLLPEVSAALDEPVGDPAFLPVYWLCREARRHVTVVLSGEGADEVFGGYGYYRRFAGPSLGQWLWLAKRKNRFDVPARLIDHDAAVTPSGFPVVLDRAHREPLIVTNGAPAAESVFERDLLRTLERAADPLQRATAWDLATWLPDDLLVKTDRMAMAHGLEGRAPYLQPDLVAAGLALPPSAKVRGARRKIALQEVAERWLPHDLVHRRKHGFVLPMKPWIRSWFESRGGVRTYLDERELPALDREAVARFVESELESGLRADRFLFALLMLLEWYHAFHHVHVVSC